MQEFPNYNIIRPTHHRHRPCLVIDFRYGAPLVCLLWVVINIYVAVLAFQKRSPVFSHLDSTVLIIQGVVCLLFAIDSLFLFYSYHGIRTMGLLKGMIYLTWLMIIIFATAFLASIAVFGIQKDDYISWCVNKSRNDVSNYLFSTPPTNDTLLPNSQLNFTMRGDGYNVYNCNRLYQDEIKLAVFLFVLIIALYLHSAYCFRSYVRREEMILKEELSRMGGGNVMPGSMGMPTTMMNIGKTKTLDPEKLEEDNQKSLAQLSRAFFGRLR